MKYEKSKILIAKFWQMDLLCEPIEIPIKCRKAYYVGCCVMIGINLAKQLLCGLRPTN